MSVKKKKIDDAILRVYLIEYEGITYFKKAHSIANDPQVRHIFERLLDIKKEHLRKLEEGFKKLGKSPPSMTEKQHTGAYPLDDIQKAECYVCGHTTEIGDIPESCPRCGASHHAFEKEITMRKAWKIAESGSHTALKVLKEIEKQVNAKIKPMISRQVQLEKVLLDEARKELEVMRKK